MAPNIARKIGNRPDRGAVDLAVDDFTHLRADGGLNNFPAQIPDLPTFAGRKPWGDIADQVVIVGMADAGFKLSVSPHQARNNLCREKLRH